MAKYQKLCIEWSDYDGTGPTPTGYWHIRGHAADGGWWALAYVDGRVFQVDVLRIAHIIAPGLPVEWIGDKCDGSLT